MVHRQRLPQVCSQSRQKLGRAPPTAKRGLRTAAILLPLLLLLVIMMFAMGFLVGQSVSLVHLHPVVHHQTFEAAHQAINTVGEVPLLEEIVRTAQKSSTMKERTEASLPYYYPLQTIPTDRIDHMDIYAGAWWQSVARFLPVNLLHSHGREEATSVPIQQLGMGMLDARMAKDWLDFSVEHLSKWWKLSGDYGTAYAIGKLHAYIQHAMTSPKVSNMMASTIAVIPHSSGNVTSANADPRLQQMVVTALTATIASLWRHGIGRVVVVGHFPIDLQQAREAFGMLQRYHTANNCTQQQQQFSDKLVVVYTDAFLQLRRERVYKFNLPVGSLLDFQAAWKGNLSQERQNEWLGTNQQQWKYIYFTEGDQVLNARDLEPAHKLMDDGGVMIPHRLQPIPHSIDLKGVVPQTQGKLLPQSFDAVEELSANVDSCCDTNEKPGQKDKECGSFWWQCGFEQKGDFRRLQNYQFFRLLDGTGIVSLAATAHSRKCNPFKRKRGCESVEYSASGVFSPPFWRAASHDKKIAGRVYQR